MDRRLCQKYNLTWALVRLTENQFISLDQNTGRFTGKAKYIVENILLLKRHESIDKSYSHCKIKLAEKYGDRIISNNSIEYDGAIGLIQQSKADILLRAGHYFISPEIIDFTVTIKPDRYQTFQFIDTKKSLKNDNVFDLFVPSRGFLIEYIILVLLGFLISIYIFKNRIKKRLNLNQYFNLSTNILFFQDAFSRLRFSTFTVFFTWFALFNYLIQQLLQNNVKTSAVIVDTQELITSIDKLINTQKECCFMEKGQEAAYFEMAPQNTLAGIIYRRLTNPSKMCFIRDNRKLMTFNDQNYKKYFLLASEFFIKVASGFLQNLNQRNGFINEHHIFELLKAFYLRKTLPKEIKNYVDSCITFLIELGFFDHFFMSFSIINREIASTSYRTYSSLNMDEYIDEFASVTNTSFKNIIFLLKIYVLINSTFLIIFLLYWIRKFLIKNYSI